MKEYLESLKIALRFLILMIILMGIIYPVSVTFIAQLLFPWQANGSILHLQGRVVGSELIGQFFNDEKYFWGRPSATARFPYDAENSSGSNVAVSSPNFIADLKSRVEALHRSDPEQSQLIPADLVTTSGSGLDPEISVDAAKYQIPRVARTNKLSEKELKDLLTHIARNKSLGVLGERRVNVLKLNLGVEKLRLKQGQP